MLGVYGIDRQQLESCIKEYLGSPKSFAIEAEAKTIWEGRGLGSLGKVGAWAFGGRTIDKPTRDFSVQIGSWLELGESLGVDGAQDRIEPTEAMLLGLAASLSQAITLTCARTAVDVTGLEVTARLTVDPGPLIGATEPVEWGRMQEAITADVTVHGDFSTEDREVIEEAATRSPVAHMFQRAGLLKTTFHYGR